MYPTASLPTSMCDGPRSSLDMASMMGKLSNSDSSFLCHLTHVTVRLHDVGDALVVERAAVAVRHHVVAVEAADERNHGFGERFPFLPVGEVVFEVRECQDEVLATWTAWAGHYPSRRSGTVKEKPPPAQSAGRVRPCAPPSLLEVLSGAPAAPPGGRRLRGACAPCAGVSRMLRSAGGRPRKCPSLRCRNPRPPRGRRRTVARSRVPIEPSACPQKTDVGMPTKIHRSFRKAQPQVAPERRQTPSIGKPHE